MRRCACCSSRSPRKAVLPVWRHRCSRRQQPFASIRGPGAGSPWRSRPGNRPAVPRIRSLSPRGSSACGGWRSIPLDPGITCWPAPSSTGLGRWRTTRGLVQHFFKPRKNIPFLHRACGRSRGELGFAEARSGQDTDPMKAGCRWRGCSSCQRCLFTFPPASAPHPSAEAGPAIQLRRGRRRLMVMVSSQAATTAWSSSQENCTDQGS